jgi:hypothetical protein
MFSDIVIQSPIETLQMIAQALLAFMQDNDVWIFLCFAAFVIGYLLYKLFNEFMLGGSPKKAIGKVQEIANLSGAELDLLRKKNDRMVVDVLVSEAQFAMHQWDRDQKRELTQREHAELLDSFKVIPERYEAIKKGGQFSQFDPNKRVKNP